MTQAIEAMILTIGLPGGGETDDVLDALAEDLRTVAPNYLALVASRQSRGRAESMARRIDLPGDHIEILELDHAHDLDEVFQRVNGLIQAFGRRGIDNEHIAINYTSGTKVMGSGAVLSAVYNKINQLRYITGSSRSRGQQPPAAARTLTTHPGAVFSYQQLLSARSMLMDLRFRSAEHALATLTTDFLTPEDRTVHENLVRLNEAYSAWDSFQPGRFLELYARVEFGTEGLEAFRLNPGQVTSIETLDGEMRTGRPGPSILIDLFNNAARRLSLGRTEDALTRLYRGFEMMAQWVLERDFGIDTNDVDTRRIPPRDRVSFEALRSMEDGLVKIGLRKAYELLIVMDTRIGRAFQANTGVRRFLEQRTESILAHGLQPETHESATRFLSDAAELFAVEIEGFQDRARAIQFPWVPEEKPLGHPTSEV